MVSKKRFINIVLEIYRIYGYYMVEYDEPLIYLGKIKNIGNLELKLKKTFLLHKERCKFYKKIEQINYAINEKRKFTNNIDMICNKKNLCDDLSINIKSYLPCGLTQKDILLIYDQHDS